MILLDEDTVRRFIGERRPDCNKGSNGRALLFAGSEGFSGAALMAAAACLRAGIGTLKVMCLATVRPALFALPEAMTLSAGESWDALSEDALCTAISSATCVGLGPGIGKSSGVARALYGAIECGLPAVIDADGLNVLAMHEETAARLHARAVLTPHPGEMSRLTGLPIDEIIAAPADIAAQYAKGRGCTVLLKGAVSFIASPDGRIAKNSSGNAGLAKGGSGDVLTGITLAMLGQGLPSFEAACAAAFILGTSADTALSLLAERFLMARDVIDSIEQTVSALDSFKR